MIPDCEEPIEPSELQPSPLIDNWINNSNIEEYDLFKGDE